MKQTLQEEPMLASRRFFRHWQGTTVRHCDLDPNDHVTNSVFGAWFDDGRYGLLKRYLRPIVAQSDVFALVSVTIDFSREIAFGELPEVGTAILEVGRSSIIMGQGLFIAGACAASCRSVTVMMDGVSRRPRPLNEAERDILMSFAGLRENAAADWS